MEKGHLIVFGVMAEENFWDIQTTAWGTGQSCS